MAVQPWNFPTYRTCGSYNFSVDSDPYFTSGNDVADFADNASWTFIGALLFPPGFSISGYAQVSGGTGGSYTPIWSIARYGENDTNYCLRTYYNGPGTEPGLQFFMYDGNGSTYIGVISCPFSNLIAQGINPEAQMLQLAISVDQSTGKRLVYVNGIEVYSSPVTPWVASTGMHRSSNARAVHNAYANLTTTTWSTGGGSREHIKGPHLVHDAFLDLADPAVRANIWDDNGDFIWPGHNGAGWLGGTTPWYYSEVGVPWNGNKGSCTATYQRVTSASYAYWGHPSGSKWDWPNAPTEQWNLARNLPGIKGVWDMSSVFDETSYFLYNPFLINGHVKRVTTSYGAYPSFPQRDGAQGAPGFSYSISTNHGYVDYNNTLDGLVQNASDIYMTISLDFTMVPTDNFGFRKVIGWRSSSSNSYFGVYTVYPSASGRDLILQWQQTTGGMQSWGIGGIPSNTTVLPITWAFNSGILRIFKGGVKQTTLDKTANGTNIYNSTSVFGWLDSTSASTGAFPVGADFVSIGLGNPSDTEILDLHAALMNGAY